MNTDKPKDKIPLHEHVRQVTRDYLNDMDSTEPDNLLQIFNASIEKPLIEEVLQKTAGNQSHAARILGVSRNTLRAKMQAYEINLQGASE